MENDLDAIEANELITNKTKITKIKIKHLKPIMAEVTPILPLLQKTFEIYGENQGEEAKNEDQIGFIAEAVQTLITNHMDSIVTLVTILTELTKEEVEELDVADFANLVARIVVFNIDFFTKTVLPKLALIKLKF